MNQPFEITELGPGDRDRALDGLVTLVVDAVEDGASVGFLAPLDRNTAVAYWGTRLDEAADGHRVVIAAVSDEQVVGAVQLVPASQQNARHRAELQRLLVLTSHRRLGIGTALMERAELVARERGWTLLVLNTRAGDPPERLYLRLGYEIVGRIPGYAISPDGTPNTTTIMYKSLPADAEDLP